MGERDENLHRFLSEENGMGTALDAYLEDCRVTAGLQEAIQHLIEYRQLLRDTELARLEAETNTLLERLAAVERERALEEIRHFKEILQLHRRFLELNGSE